jgi:hypothetical protein
MHASRDKRRRSSTTISPRANIVARTGGTPTDLLVHADLLSDLDELGSLDANVFNVQTNYGVFTPSMNAHGSLYT